jgi:hypothetical protein
MGADMNIKTLFSGFFSVFLCATCAFGEESDEITKIDKRLEELKLIWNQEQAIINGYTKHRTVPVQQGTRAHQAVLVSLKRIQMAEAEAAKLKENRKNIEAGGTAGGTASTSADEPIEIREFSVEATKEKGDSQKNTTLVFKGFYLGMPGGDALGLLNHYMKYAQASEKPVKPPENQNAALAGAFAEIYEKAGLGGLVKDELGLEQPFQIVSIDDQLVISKRLSATRYFALLDQDGKVVEFKIDPAIRDTLFGSKGTPLDEFIETFTSQYGIPSIKEEQITLKMLDETIGQQEKYSHRDSKGFEVIFWGESTIFDAQKAQEMKMLGGDGGDEGEIIVKNIKPEKERISGFD